jgi:hypothetical protein
VHAPELRLQHLRSRKADAISKGDTTHTNYIMQIIRCEQMQGRFKDVNGTNRVRKGGGCVFKVEKWELDGSTMVHNTQEER